MPLSSPPAFQGGFGNIPVGTAGQVLTSNGPNAAPSFKAASGGGGLSNYVAYAGSAAGANNNVNAGLAAGKSGRLLVTLPNGAANWTGLVAGSDGDEWIIINGDATNSLTLNNQNAGSLAANQFLAGADLVIPPGDSIRAVYTAQTLNKWVIA